MEITKKEIKEMADAYVNESTRAYWPTIEKSYFFEGYVEGIMEFCQKMNINVITNSDD